MMPLKARKITLTSIFAVSLIFFAHTSYAAKWVVVRVLDDDTVKAKSLSKEITIRLVGIDAPETGKKKNNQDSHIQERPGIT
jgi:endonuclease YncB( thermonuclease family)